MQRNNKIKVIVSGGGTGGHIFPAIAIANALVKRLVNNVAVLFVGAEGRMEMERVPEAGYEIIGLPVAGFQRGLSWSSFKKNCSFPFKLIRSMSKAKKVIKNFNPDVVVGVGGYASGPILRCATSMKIPALIQEQNSFPGITNKIVAKKVQSICVAYPNLERFFPAEKIVLTGNPIRRQAIDVAGKEEEAKQFFGLLPDKPTLLVVGGSQGARSINEGIAAGVDRLCEAGIQLIWQTGKLFIEEAASLSQRHPQIKNLPFIKEMNLAYAAADLIVSRAGAIAISELCNIGKPVIFVPLPTAAEDHQTQNAKVLTDADAALLVADEKVRELLVPTIITTMENKALMKRMGENIKSFAIADADERIVDEIEKLIKGF